MIVTERERERERERQAEGEAGSMHREPDVGFDPGSPESVSYTHLTLPTTRLRCRSRWSPYH